MCFDAMTGGTAPQPTFRNGAGLLRGYLGENPGKGRKVDIDLPLSYVLRTKRKKGKVERSRKVYFVACELEGVFVA